MEKLQMAAYVAAFIDGEGCIQCVKTSRGPYMRRINFSNTDKVLIDRMIGFLTALGFKTYVQFVRSKKPKWRDKWVVYLASGKENYARFKELIPLQSPKKIAALEKIIEHSYIDKETIRKHLQNGRETPCGTCGEPVYVSLANVKRGYGKYCSNRCAWKARQNRAQKSCAVCGVSFTAIGRKAKERRFCSRDCQTAAVTPMLRAQASRAVRKRWTARHPS